MYVGSKGTAHENPEYMAAISIRYELSALEEFIHGECLPANTGEGLAAGKLRRWEQFIESESKKIRANMTGQVLSISKPRHLELYIQHHQAGIIDLSNALWEMAHRKPAPSEISWKDFYTGLQEQLLALLDFLKHYFDGYFDHYQNLPRYYLEERLQQLPDSYLKVLSGPMEQHLQLLDGIREYWQSIADGRNYQLSFHEEQYFETFFKVLNRRPAGSMSEEDLLELLLQFNYNDSRFMDYCRYGLIAALDKIESEEEQLNFLAEKIKQLKQIPQRKVNAYTPANPDVISYCRQWMEEEYHFIQSRVSLRQEGQEGSKHYTATGMKPETWLPVSQLGILLHLIHHSGAIRLRNKTAYINFFAQHLVTKDQERISGKNLRNSYYNIDLKSVPAIKDLLYAMLKQLREFE